jgi:two-component system, LuxR family, sensor kinase FixL
MPDSNAEHAGGSERTQLDPGKVLNAMADGVVIVDRSGTIQFVNERLVDLSGYDQQQLVGSSIEMLVPEPVRKEHQQLRESAQGEEGLHRPMGTGRDIVLRRSDGSVIPVDVALSQMDRHVVASVRDARSSRAMQTALDEERKRAAVLSERARIARDLHDGIIQQLFAVGLGLRASPNTDLESKRSEAVQRIDDAIKDLRAYVTGMHSDATPRSLVGSLTDVITQLRSASAAPIEPMIDTRTARLLAPHSAILVNFAREAMMNAIRHGKAKRIELSLTGERGLARLEIADDGQGFDANDHKRGSGLPNMHARAAAIGGRLHIDSRPGLGTKVILEIPLSKRTEPETSSHD